MKKITHFFVFLLTVLSFSNLLIAQTGPGGIGNATGTNGHPKNILWLDADDLGLANNDPVTAWNDKSGLSNSLSPSVSDANNPVFITNIINSLPVVRFSSATGTGTKLIKNTFSNFATDAITTIIVYSTTDANDGIVSYATSTDNNNYLLLNNSNLTTYVVGGNQASSVALNGGSFQIVTNKWRSNDGNLYLFRNGTSVYNRTGFRTASSITTGGCLAIGGEQDAVDGSYAQNQAFDGDIAEIIMFSSYVNDAQRIIIENYLNVKYGITISKDVFTNISGYTYDLTGIGQEVDGNHTTAESGSTGFYVESASGLDNGDYIMFAHNNSANSVSTSDITGSVEQRWSKDWYIEQTGSQNAQIIFDLPEGIAGGQYPQNISNYVLLYRSGTTGDYSIATTSGVGYGDADQVAFTILGGNLSNGYYTLGTTDLANSPVIGAAGTTWYTLASGNWSDPEIWTLDPSGALPNNPANSYPQNATDKIVIKTGKTVTMDLTDPTYSFASVTVNGRLDLQQKTGLTFNIIKGSGRIRMAGDVFPLYTNADHFIKPDQGEGTVVLYGNDFNLATAHEFYNLEVEMTAGQTVTLMNDYTLNGYLMIKSGTFMINDNASTTGLTINVKGDVDIFSGAFINTGTGNARHQFNFYGNLTNNGELRFTNRVAANYTAEATDGIVDANFLNSSANQAITCNGVSNFYRIEIDKGTDKTYILSIEASDPANFNLFGYANEPHADIAQLVSNNNSLGLLRGTVKIGNNIVINRLSGNANYNISEAARLWVAGGTVYNNNGNSTVPYGTLEVSAGLMESKVSSGITLRDNGLIKISGGTINTNQIRTSVLGASNVGAYVQSGGTVNIVNPGSTNSDYYHFCLTYTGNVFNMSGGTLHVYDANGATSQSGGIFINSFPGNVNVTGGTVIAEIETTTNPFKITSRAPFYNLILRNTLDNTTLHVLAEGTDVGSTDEYLAVQPIVANNDLTIETNAELNANNTDVYIGGDFTVESGATYNHGTNTTYFNTDKESNINLTALQTFNNLTLAKTSDDGNIVIVSGASTAIQVDGELRVEKGSFDYGSYIVDLNGNLYLADSIGTISSTGGILFSGSSQQQVTSENGVIQNMEINNTYGSGSNINLAGDLNIFGTLALTDGVLDINTYKLTMYGADANISGTFGAGEMIQTDGNASDGGLIMYVDANETLTFPIGTDAQHLGTRVARYTPAVGTFSSINDDGYVRISVADDQVPMTIGNGGDIIYYYWKVRHSDFSVEPVVSSYVFTYDESDATDGETGLQAGKVLDVSPYTQSTENGHDRNSNTITFNDGFPLEFASYTAGNSSRFQGKPDTYYSRQSGDFNTASTWSRNEADGTGTQQVPVEGSIVIIQNSNRVNINNLINNLATVVFDHDYVTYPTPTSENVPRLQFHISGTFNIGVASGTGMISFNAPNAPVVNGDFGDFGNNTDSYYLYFGGNATLSNIPTPIPSLMVESATYTIDQAITINSDFIIQGNGTAIGLQDITVKRNLLLGWWNGGTYQFPATGSSTKLTVEGDIDYTQMYLTDGTGRRIQVEDAVVGTPLIHNLVLSGDIIQGSENDYTFDLYRASDRPFVNLELTGTTDNTYSRTSAAVPELYRIIMNKGLDQTSTFTFSDNVALNGSTGGAGVDKALELQNGKLILDDVSINFDLTTGDDDFEIPSSACLEIHQGQVNANGGSGILLEGKLFVSGGTVDMTGGDNYIQYSASGNATIEVSSGTLSVGSQVRRGVSSDQGILTFNQSGGTVNLGVSAAGESNRGIFEIMNSGSSFTHSAGDFHLVNDYRINPSTQSFYFDPETVNLTTGTAISFGNASTVASEKDFTLYAGKNLMNLIIDNVSSNNPTVTLNVVPLNLDENLTINSGTTLDANALDINISGNFTNAGNFVANGNTTVFKGSVDQIITGATTFYNLTKNTANELSLAVSSEITVENVLSLEDGTFDDNDNNVSAKGNVYSIITTSSAGTSAGIIMCGTVEQEITGTGTYARLSINNINGVIVPTGYTITVTESLKMQSGILDIGRNLLELAENASIVEATPFSESNMIQTNISFTDAGVRKYFPQISAPSQFIYPMGSVGKYTPVQFDITACDAGGSIRVRAADERHVSVIEDSEAPDPEIIDVDNVLQYHWTLDANSITGFSATATLESYPEDVMVTAPYTVADYITARLLNSGMGAWTKYDVTDFNEATNELYFYFAGTNDLGIDGDYTAGIDDAIPDMVPSYITKQDGSWNDANTWDTHPVSGGDVPAGGPRGAIVYIEHNVTMPVNFMASYITNIGAAGVVNVGTTFGHRLGIVNGTGKLYVERGDIPAGVYDGFFAIDSGTIEYGYTGILDGNQNYDILSEITYVNNLILSGSGERRFPNLDVTIYGDWTMTVESVINEHNQTITVDGDVNFTPGSFDAGSGADAIVQIGGSSTQTITGNFTGTNAFNHFQMNNPAGATLLSSNIEIDNNLILTSGVLYSSASNTVTLNNTGEGIVSGGGNGSHISGPLFKQIIGGGAFYFPVGNGGRFGRISVTNGNVSTGYWQAQYYNQNPLSAGYDPTIFDAPLTMVSTNEYWRVQGPTGTDAGQIGLRWDGQSGMPTYNGTVINQLKIVEWRDPDTSPADGDTSDDKWVDVAGTYTNSGSGSTGTISSSTSFTFDEFTGAGNIFTLSSEATPLTPNWQGDVSSNWNDPNNWSTVTVPTSVDDVTITTASPNEPVINTNAVCRAMTLSLGRTLTIAPAGSLTLSGALAMNGNITIQSDATGTGSLIDNGITSTGVATVQRYISGGDAKPYHYISSPLSAVPSSLYRLVPGEYPNPNFYEYNENFDNVNIQMGWVTIGAAYGNLKIGSGYAYAFSRNYTFNMTGGNFNTGNINAPVTFNANNGAMLDGWNLIGNPYPSAISAEDFLSNANNQSLIVGTVYFWDDDGSEGAGYDSFDYATWNLAGAIGSSSGSGSKVPDGFISNGQGFFVHATLSGNLNFTNSMRRVGNGQFFKKSSQDETMRLRISLTNEPEKLYNEALLVFMSGATDGFDRFYDGKKIKGNPDIAFYSLLNMDEYAIQSFKPLNIRYRPVKEIPIGYKVTTPGTYSFNLVGLENIGNDVNVYLEDKETGETVDLKQVNNYEFTTLVGTFNQRFIIRFNLKGEYENSAPLLRRAIDDYSTEEDQYFNLELDKNTFADVDVNDKLSYSAKLVGGNQLPDWINFNSELLTFTGLPQNEDVGMLSIEVRVTDNSGETASDVFEIEVFNVNDAPLLINEIPDQQVDESAAYTYTIPSNTFTDIDVDDEFTLSVKMVNGEALPGWLAFDSGTGNLSGTAVNPGDLHIFVTATDKAGAFVSDEFILSVKNTATGIEETVGNELTIYPNPTKGELILETQEVTVGTRFIVRDNFGKHVVTKLSEGKTTCIDLSKYADGVYFIEVTDGIESKVYKVMLNK